MKIMHGNQTTGPESSKTTSNIKTGRELCQSKPLVHHHEAWKEHTNQKYTHRTTKSTYQQAETPGTQPELIRANQNKYSGIHRIQSSENYTAITTTASRRTMTDTLARTRRPGSWTDEVTKEDRNKKKSNEAPDVSPHLSQILKWEVYRQWEHRCAAHWPPQQVMELNLPVREALCTESHDCGILDRGRAP
jgi:hypothetical protein